MKFKLFGKDIFEFNKRGSDVLLYNSTQSLEKSKYLPDFFTMRENNNQSGDVVSWAIESPTMSGISTSTTNNVMVGIKKEEKANMKKFTMTPKKLFELKFLNKKDFKIQTSKEYVDSQLQQFKDKLNLIKIASFDMSRGTNEIASVIVRLENRKQYDKFNTFFDNYAYTTTERINSVIKNHSNLKLGQIEQFIADMPKEAVDAMKQYTKKTEELCKKKPVFYIIADKKDFRDTDKRRDPILLAQSPFGHFWQILGAWDAEMLFLEEL